MALRYTVDRRTKAIGTVIVALSPTTSMSLACVPYDALAWNDYRSSFAYRFHCYWLVFRTMRWPGMIIVLVAPSPTVIHLLLACVPHCAAIREKFREEVAVSKDAIPSSFAYCIHLLCVPYWTAIREKFRDKVVVSKDAIPT